MLQSESWRDQVTAVSANALGPFVDASAWRQSLWGEPPAEVQEKEASDYGTDLFLQLARVPLGVVGVTKITIIMSRCWLDLQI